MLGTYRLAEALKYRLDNLDSIINEKFEPVSEFISNIIFYSVQYGEAQIKLIVVWLFFAALFFSFYLKFVNIWGFKHSIDLISGKFKNRFSKSKGEVTHFQALTAALSGTVGLGNIAGVAVAISLGGPGATLWMIFAGFLAMAAKFVECSLGLKYRIFNSNGTVSGGPMYYLSRGLSEIGYAGLGKILAVFFAVAAVFGSFGGGNMFQANQSFKQLLIATGGEASILNGYGWLFGFFLAFIVGIVIIGGIKSIAKVTEKVVPFMGGIYSLAALVIIFINYEMLPSALTSIFITAFTPEAGMGGILGVLIVGFQRATFSNEAGIGSAPIAYSAVKSNDHMSVGFVSLFEPFFDTIIICTMTALVIIISGVYDPSSGITGVELTSQAFKKDISWFPYILSLAVVLFAFSTIITWSYYGMKAWTYLVGNNIYAENFYKIIFCTFIVIGAASELDSVIHFSDAMIFAMAFPNVIGMYFLASGLKSDLYKYKKSFLNNN